MCSLTCAISFTESFTMRGLKARAALQLANFCRVIGKLSRKSPFHISICAKPFDSISKRFPGRRLRQAELANGFRRIEPHFIFGHANASQRRTRRYAGNKGGDFVDASRGKRDSIRNFNSRRPDAGDFFQAWRAFHAWSNCPLRCQECSAHPYALFPRRECDRWPRRAHEPSSIPCRDIAGNLRFKKSTMILSRRRWLYIARANGRSGIHNDDGKTFARKTRGDLFRHPFRTFVMIGHLRRGDP